MMHPLQALVIYSHVFCLISTLRLVLSKERRLRLCPENHMHGHENERCCPSRLTLCLCTAHTGTSSFGMSGVNAHAILAQDLERASVDGPKQTILPWRKQRCWAAPVVSMLLTSAAALSAFPQHTVSFSCRLDPAHLSYLLDHRSVPTKFSICVEAS